MYETRGWSLLWCEPCVTYNINITRCYMSVRAVKCYSSLFLHLPQALVAQGGAQCWHHFGQVGSSTSLAGGLQVRVERCTSSWACDGGEGYTGSDVWWAVLLFGDGEGGWSEASVRRLRKWQLRTSIRPLLVLIKYLQLGPIITIVPYMSLSLLCWFCRATRQPTWISGSGQAWVS